MKLHLSNFELIKIIIQELIVHTYIYVLQIVSNRCNDIGTWLILLLSFFQAPSNKKVQVYFDDFNFYRRISTSSGPACYWDKVEMRLSGGLGEGTL